MGPSRLADRPDTLVLDASAALNLLGTGRAASVLRLIAREVVMVDKAAEEVLRDPLTGAAGPLALAGLEAAGLLRTVSLSDAGYLAYLGLVGASEPTDSLDDGEATVAHALDIGAVALLDERKATRVAQALTPSRPPLCTLDLLSGPAVTAAFGTAQVADTVFSALMRARMRVPPPFRAWVTEMAGPDRLRECASVPRSWLASVRAADEPPGPAR